MNINVLQGGVEENVGVYAEEKCSIPAGMGKYVPVQTKHDYRRSDVMHRDARRSRSTI